jgi:hypothetical protein
MVINLPDKSPFVLALSFIKLAASNLNNPFSEAKINNYLFLII